MLLSPYKAKHRGQVSKIRTTVTDIDLVHWKVHSLMYNALGERESSPSLFLEFVLVTKRREGQQIHKFKNHRSRMFPQQPARLGRATCFSMQISGIKVDSTWEIVGSRPYGHSTLIDTTSIIHE